MLLAIDVGNTHIVVGVFDGENLVADYRVHTDERMTRDELGVLLTELLERRDISPAQVEAVAVSSVVPAVTRTVEDVSTAYFRREPLVVGPGIRTGLRIHYEDPRQVGADRIANAIAARTLYPGAAVIVDFGTATTFDAISAAGEYVGGSIAPGLEVSHDALVRHAARLSRVELTPPPSAIGHSTITSMQSGLVYGYVGLVQGIVARFRTELDPQARVIATGGLASRMAPLIDVIDVVDERLTLLGLRLIHEQNAR